jgi:hypothetical protein
MIGELAVSKFLGPRRLYSTLSEEEAFSWPSPRRTLCPNYDDCLDYAGDRFWTSFTCKGCLMEALIFQGKMKELTPPEDQAHGSVWDYPLIIHEPPACLLS